jgi:carbon-monoxide dehydrogenase small subunit
MKKEINIKINNDMYKISINPWQTLNEIIRDSLNLTGTKLGCETGNCGSCTVIMNGKSINSCLTLAIESDKKEILTVEGLTNSNITIHPIQKSFIEKGAIQCGFCTPGMELSSLYLLEKNNKPNIEEIKEAISGNLCRCTGYLKIIEAINDIKNDIKKD